MFQYIQFYIEEGISVMLVGQWTSFWDTVIEKDVGARDSQLNMSFQCNPVASRTNALPRRLKNQNIQQE